MKKINLVITFSALLFTLGFNANNQKNDEDIKVKLVNNNDIPTSEELDDFYKDYKDDSIISSGMKMLHYFDDATKEVVGSIGFGDEEVWEDDMGYTNYEVSAIAPDLVFKKGYIYLFDPYDYDKTTDSELSITANSFFKGVYGIDLNGYGDYYSTYLLDFMDGEYKSYDEMSARDIKCFKYLDGRINSLFDKTDYHEETYIFGFVPSVDFVATKLSEPTSTFKKEIKLSYSSSDYQERPYNYSSDFGLYITKYKTTNNDIDAADITGPTFVIDVDHPKSIDEIKSQLIATDDTDGDITDKIKIVYTNYCLVDGKIKTGVYTLKVSVEDNAHNVSEAEFNIIVEDIKAPDIFINDITISYTKTLYQEDFIKLFDYSDNYNKKEELTFLILENEYTDAEPFKDYKVGVGVYHVKARVVDKAGNEKEGIATINVIDDIMPRITVEKNIKSTTTSPISIADIKKKIDVEDMVDGKIDYVLTEIDDYSNNIRHVGTYKFNVFATDKSNNYATIDFNVIVEDSDFPVISYKMDYIIVVSENEKITKEKIIEILTGAAHLTNYEVISISSDYFDNMEKSGDYQVVLKCIDYDNNEQLELKSDITYLSKLNIEQKEIVKQNVFEEYTKEVIIILSSFVVISFMIIFLFYPYKKRLTR